MRVGVHLQALRPGKIGGLEDYVRRLLTSMTELDGSLELVLYCAEHNAETLAGNGRELRVLSAAEFAALDGERLSFEALELWFCPLLALEPASPGLPAVVTVPDLQHEAYPEFFRPEILDWRRRSYARTAERADHILTFSEHSRRQIVDLLGADPARVTVTYLASTLDGTGTGREEVRARYDLPDEYFFYPGAAWPHKNHRLLFEALALLGRHPGDPPSLVLTGARIEGGVDLERDWRELGLDGRVRALGYVPREEMPALYALGLATVVPSLFEGFGMPVVEAMAAGSPVICSAATSLPEVAGDAALYFDPARPDQLSDLLASLRAVGDDAPAAARRREELARAGRLQAEKFDWRRTARSTLDAFAGVLERRRAEVASREAVGAVPADGPLITVVTPSLDQGTFIGSTIESVLGQSHRRVEHLVIDGGSSDGTVDVLRRWRRADPRRFDFLSESDRGQAHAVNKGFERARGEIVGWLNSDDVYEPGCLAAVAAAFAEHPEWDLLYGRAHYVDEAGDLLGVYPTRPRFEWQTLAHECFICQPTVFIRRRVTGELGFRLDESLKTCMDYDFWIRLGRELEVGFLDRVLARSRMYRDNKTIRHRSEVYREIFRTVTKHYRRLPLSWALGRAHHVWDHGDPFFNVRRPTAVAYLIAGLFLLRHNWASPRHWPSLCREVRMPVKAKMKKLWRALLRSDPAT